MIYTKRFSLSDFEWYDKARKVVGKIGKANETERFLKLLEDRFDSEDDTPSDIDINDFVSMNGETILSELGICPKRKKKKYKVFLRITATDMEEVEADSPEEARAKAEDAFYNNFDDMFMTIMREDVESAVPVAYDEGDGETKDYPPEEQEDH